MLSTTKVLAAVAAIAMIVFGSAERASAFGYRFTGKWGTEGPGAGYLSYPTGLALDGLGQVYVLEAHNFRVSKFDRNGGFITYWGSYGTAEGRFSVVDGGGIAVDRTTFKVYVADVGNRRIQKFDAAGNFERTWGWGVQDGASAFQVCTSGCQAGVVGAGDGQFFVPIHVAVDAAGDVYVVDHGNARIQVFGADGTFKRTWGWGVQDGTSALQVCISGCQAGIEGAGDGQLYSPYGIAIDAGGRVFVGDHGNYRVQRFAGDGTFERMWGWGVQDGTNAFQICTSGCQTGLYGTGEGQFLDLQNVGVDAIGYVYVTEDGASYGPERVQKFDANGAFVTTWGSYGAADGQFTYADGVAIDAAGTVYVSDGWSHRIQKFHLGADFDASWGVKGTLDGQFKKPQGVGADAAGSVYVADTANHRLQKLDTDGNHVATWGLKGALDGQFKNPNGVAIDTAGNVYVADSVNHRIQKLDAAGAHVATWGGKGDLDGQFKKPLGIAVDGAGNVYVADTANHRIQKLDAVTGAHLATWGVKGTLAGQFKNPYGVAVDTAGNVYVADTNNHRVQKLDAAGTHLATWCPKGSLDGQCKKPRGIAVDADGYVFVADTANHRIQAFDANGNFLATWGAKGVLAGQFKNPNGVAVGGDGKIVVADTANHRVQRFE